MPIPPFKNIKIETVKAAVGLRRMKIRLLRSSRPFRLKEDGCVITQSLNLS